jgi:hypothetical protein
MFHFHRRELLVYNNMHSPYHPICRRKIYYTPVIGLKYVWWLIYCHAVLQSGWSQDHLRDSSVIILHRFMIIFNLLFPVTLNILRCMMCNWCAIDVHNSLYSHRHATVSHYTEFNFIISHHCQHYFRLLEQNPGPSGY